MHMHMHMHKKLVLISEKHHKTKERYWETGPTRLRQHLTKHDLTAEPTKLPEQHTEHTEDGGTKKVNSKA